MLNELSKEIHEGNLQRGFDTNTNIQHFAISMALIHSEVSEAVEADRKGKHCDPSAVQTYNSTNTRGGNEKFFRENIKDTAEDEIADVIIRVLDFCGANNIDIDAHVKAKLTYNATRGWKHGKEY